jgi:hypothetical protein
MVHIVMLSNGWNIGWMRSKETNHRSSINNQSAISVHVDSLPPILVIRFPMDSFIISVLSSDIWK